MSNLKPFVSHNLFDELLRDVNPGYFIKPLHGEPLPNQIKVDVKENPNEFIVEAEIPGAGKDNIQIDIEGKLVTVRAQISQVDMSIKKKNCCVPNVTMVKYRAVSSFRSIWMKLPATPVTITAY